MPPIRLAFATALGVLIAASPAAAGSIESALREAGDAGMPAITVFVDAQFGARTDGAARRLSTTHATAARHGFELVDVESYTENGDLVGFFVSYRRTQPRPREQP